VPTTVTITRKERKALLRAASADLARVADNARELLAEGDRAGADDLAKRVQPLLELGRQLRRGEARGRGLRKTYG
jgi:hypothetical protein